MPPKSNKNRKRPPLDNRTPSPPARRLRRSTRVVGESSEARIRRQIAAADEATRLARERHRAMAEEARRNFVHTDDATLHRLDNAAAAAHSAVRAGNNPNYLNHSATVIVQMRSGRYIVFAQRSRRGLLQRVKTECKSNDVLEAPTSGVSGLHAEMWALEWLTANGYHLGDIIHIGVSKKICGPCAKWLRDSGVKFTEIHQTFEPTRQWCKPDITQTRREPEEDDDDESGGGFGGGDPIPASIAVS